MRNTWKYTRRCGHTHVSGRQCGNRVPIEKQPRACQLHVTERCTECESLKEAWKPVKGW